MAKTIGDSWRESNNSELATRMVDFFIVFFKSIGLGEEDIDLAKQYQIFLEFFNTSIDDISKEESSNGYSYLN